ncbi:hypothetical protein [Sorangium sp. So ce1182]|uniref:hypothetical protein n=1 Tax=Sorangium sp. So ce1182 TaxID=3133334 RepID=UPI003F644A9D
MTKVHGPLALLILYPALVGCGAGETLTDEVMIDGEGPLGTTSQALVRTNRTFARKAAALSGDDSTRREHCLVENGQFELDGVSVGTDVFREKTQVLLSDSNNTLRGLCTVAGQADTGDANFYMATQGSTNGGFEARFGSSAPRSGITVSNRWSTTAPLHAIAEPAATLADLTTDTANTVMEFGDRARDTGKRGVLYAAAHPFETGSFDQVEHIHDTLDYQSWDTVWALGIKNQNSNADAAFHITATDISGLSFPQLGFFMNGTKRLPYAVSFHGFSSSSTSCSTYELKIGGGVESDFRRGVKEIVAEYRATPASPSGMNIGYWDDGNCDLSGSASANFINRVTKGDRGLQLEQRSDMLDPTSGSSDWRNDVTEATKSVYDCLLDASDDSSSTTSTAHMLSGTTTTYGTTGVACPRWIGEITLNTVTSPTHYTMTAGALLDSCEVGAHAHVDIYKLNGDNAWVRIGGGRVQYENVNGSCKDNEKGWNGGGQLNEPSWDWRPSEDELGNGTYRAVVRATRASGAPAKAFFKIVTI